MVIATCPWCLEEFADDPDLAYHLVNDHRVSALDESLEGLEQTVKDIVYLLIEADDDTEKTDFVRDDG